MKVVAAVAMPPVAIGNTATSAHIYAFLEDGTVYRRPQKGGDWDEVEPVPGTPAAEEDD